MRPARKGPENNRVDRDYLAGGSERPSMRPARKGPENAGWPSARRRSTCSFNEAGPQGAGKRAPTTATRSRGAPFNEAGPQGAGKPTLRNPLRFQVFTAAPRALPLSRRASEPAACRLAMGDIVTCSVVKDLPIFEHSPCIPAALERSLRCRGTPQTMTGSRRTAWNFLPRLTTRGSAPSATPTSTSTTWSLA